MDFDLPEHARDLRRTVRDFCEREVRTQARDWDRSGVFPRETVGKLGQLGMLGLALPEDYGGAALDMVSIVTVVEEIARWDGLGCAGPWPHTTAFVQGHLKAFGSEAQKRKFLPAPGDRRESRRSKPGRSPARDRTRPDCAPPPCAKATAGS